MKPILPAILIVVLSGISASGAEGGEVQEAEILRDPWGIPHVFAATETAGFFGLGHASAEDRILQMDLLRRRAAGRLAEVFGPEWVDSDREARIAGHIPHAAAALAKLPGEMRAWIDAYAAGVNAWTASHAESAARRFAPLGIRPEPWTPADCLLVARGLLSLGSPFTEGPIGEYRRFRELADRVGEAEALGSSRMPVDDAAAIVTEADMARDAEAYRRLKARPKMPGFGIRAATGEGPKMSHAWAVGGGRSATGKPILESDPQLTLCSPPFFYEIHLSAGRIDARGLGLPGCPGLFIGFNRRIAWGASALGGNATAVFLDRLAPDGKGFLFEGKIVPFERRLERIRVKGAPDVVQEVLANRHGVVFNSLARDPGPGGEAYVLHDAQVAEAGSNVQALLAFLTAGGWDEFRSAMEHYYDPGLHIVYADVEGNIGYHTLIHRPLTTRSPRLAQEGWTGRDEIAGRIPLDELPRMLNPADGFISHANNMPAGSWYPHDLGLSTGGTGHTSRSWRLRQLLEGDRKFSLEDFEAVLHRDDTNPIVAALLPAARKVVEEDGVDDPQVLRLLDAVKGWDLRAGSAGRLPAARSLENTLTPYRRAGLQEVYGAGGGGVTHLARAIGVAFARDGTAPKMPAVRRYLVDWLRASAAGSGGRRPAAAGGEAATIVIPYQKTIPLNLPAVDPSLDIVSPPLACLDTGTIWSQPGNLYTQIVDLADIDRSRAMIAPGNSEDAGSPFRTAGIEIWARGGTRPAPLSREKVEGLGTARTAVAVRAYEGPRGPQALTVEALDPGWRLVAAIPAAAPGAKAAGPKPLPGRKPDDPELEAAFRAVLRQGAAPEDVDARLAACRERVRGDAGLTEQLRQAAVLGIHLIEESAAGRLRVPYGSPHVLARLREILRELGEGGAPPPEAPRTPEGRRADRPGRAGNSEVWLCHGSFDALLEDGAEWPFVREHLDGIKVYVDSIGGGRRARRSAERLERLARLCRKEGIELAVECGGTLEFAPLDATNGERSAEIELAKIRPLADAGAAPAYLDVDGAVNRLLYPGEGKRGLASADECVTELIDALTAHRRALPDLRFWLLVNFPNWGWKGGVSYHARGPDRQDWGDYFPVLEMVLARAKEAGIPLTAVTADNPWDYAAGLHSSVSLPDPRKVDWIARLRDLEDHVEERGLEFNLIVNSEAGGHASAEAFCRDTLAFVDAYRAAGGSPERWIVQSWYPHPKAVVPETEAHTMTWLAKAVIEKVRGAGSAGTAARAGAGRRIVLSPRQGEMSAGARAPGLDGAEFVLGIPETIGCREAMLLNFPEARIEWSGPDEAGAVSCSWGPGGRVSYDARIVPFEDHIDVEMTVRNHTEFLWRDVFAFNCLNPVSAPAFKDWKLERTYMASGGKPLRMDGTRRVKGRMPTVGFYLPDRIQPGRESIFVRGFGATSPDRTDGSWIVTLSEPAGSYMAAETFEAAFLFDNLDRCCIHAAPLFGDIGPGEASTAVSRIYLARGGLEDFLARRGADRVDLERRQRWARPAGGGGTDDGTGGGTGGGAPARSRRAAPGAALLLPPPGRIVHGMGQWEESNARLLRALPAEVRPAAQLLFIDIGDTPRGWRPRAIAARLEALGREGFVPVLDIGLRGNQPGREELAKLADPLFGIDHEVAETDRFDGRIGDIARIVAAFGRPVLVRIGGEFNGWWNGYHPFAFPKAYRKIAGMLRAGGAGNAALCWCYEPAAPGDFDERDQQGNPKWFPGDDVVDWFGIDWFDKGDFTGPLEGGRRGGGLSPHGRSRKFLDMAVAHGKPVIVAESAPCRYDLADPAGADAAWREWFEPYFRILEERPEIRWFHLISYDWTRSSYFGRSGWKQNDLTASPALLARVVEELRKPRYLHAAEAAKLGAGAGTAGRSGPDGETGARPGTATSPAPAARPRAAQGRESPDAAPRRYDLAAWDDPAAHLPPSGPGGTEWDGEYRSFIQADEDATSKGLPSHKEAAARIEADAAKSPESLRKHMGWVLFIRHHSRAYRPESATADLRKLWEALAARETGRS